MPAAHLSAIPLARYIQSLRDHGVSTEIVTPPGISDEQAGELLVNFATADSREVVPGTLFVCKGKAFKREYLEGSLAAGAIVYLSETTYEGVGAPCLLVNDVRRAMGVVANLLWDNPSQRIDVCAMTGTKGKTTSVYYLKGILDARAAREGTHETPIFSSVLLDDGVTSGISKLTTPEAFELQRHVANAASVGAKELVMEASSQALKYDRSYGLEFAVAAFTNIGEDHISPIEHPDFEDYFSSKLKIFAQARTAVVNLDCDHVERILDAAKASPRMLAYSQSNPEADVMLLGAERRGPVIAATVRTPRFTCEICIPSPAFFNVANALCAIACAEALGIDQESIQAGLENVVVPGRMQVLPTVDERIVGIIDFAHNGMSLEALLGDLRAAYPDRELCVVFGATGGKGLDRRETMGRVAGKMADRIVITEDDPGPEDVEVICETIAQCVSEQGHTNWQIVTDREEAIRTAVRETTRPAVVIVTGKGHETRMLRKGGAEPCEADADMLNRALAEYFA